MNAPPAPADTFRGLQLQSTATAAGELRLSLVEMHWGPPAADEVIVRIEASPLNPSDIGTMLGPADLSTARRHDDDRGDRALVFTIPPAALGSMAGRLDQPLPIGNEGAGTVVAAGPDAAHLLGRTVAVFGGAMYAEYRTLKAIDCLPLHEGTSAADGASCFVNPLTALGMVETMRREGHQALVHTAAASNLGQMLQRLCLREGIGLVNVVRSPEQADLLRTQGAVHVCDSSQPGFQAALVDAIAATGATLGFDAVGGGPLAGQILDAMEAAALRRSDAPWSRYGTPVHKQVYLYGTLDPRPTEIARKAGFQWGLGGWLLFRFLEQLGPHAAQRLRERVRDEIGSTFASRYTRRVTLAQLLDPAVVGAAARRATGEKLLVEPSRHDA